MRQRQLGRPVALRDQTARRSGRRINSMIVELSDVRCSYQLLGSGDPLVLIPGLGATCALWDCVAGELSNSFSVILLDNRGMGRSIAKRTPQTLADFAVDVVELLDHLQ